MRPIAIILLVLLFTGCSKLKDKQKAPGSFFMQSETVSVNTSSLQGTVSHKITDIWYYVNNQFKGAYPVGNIFPIPSTSQTQITLYGGIKNNGISTTRQPYEFYEPIVIDTAVDPGILVKRNFTFKYKSATKFHLIEPFEGFGSITGTSIKTSNNSDTTFQILDKATNASADVFEGNKCMYFAVDNDKKVGMFETTVAYNLPKGGAPVYLEINYKASQAFDIGVLSGSSTQYAITVNGTDGWNKIYIQLSTAVSTLQSSTCSLYFRAFYDGSAPVQQFWIDNIKILSYQ
jgi:hypothetical protein